MVRDDNRSEDLHQPVGNHENAPAVAGSAHRYYGVLLLARGGRELQQAFRQRREHEWQVSRTWFFVSETLIRGPAPGLTLRYSNLGNAPSYRRFDGRHISQFPGAHQMAE